MRSELDPASRVAELDEDTRKLSCLDMGEERLKAGQSTMSTNSRRTHLTAGFLEGLPRLRLYMLLELCSFAFGGELRAAFMLLAVGAVMLLHALEGEVRGLPGEDAASLPTDRHAACSSCASEARQLVMLSKGFGTTDLRRLLELVLERALVWMVSFELSLSDDLWEVALVSGGAGAGVEGVGCGAGVE